MISDEKVGPKGVRVRCKKCGNVIPVRRVAQNGALAAEQAAPAAASTPAPVPGGLDAELGQAFDHAFGSTASSTPAPGAGGPAHADASSAPDANADPLPVEVEPSSGAAAAGPAPSRTPAPVAAPAATEWYVAIGQAQVGPLPLEDVRRKWEGADVGPDSLVWRPGMGDWAPLSSVSDLAAYLAPFPVSPRQSRTPTPAASTLRADRSPTPAPTPAPGDVTWEPVGASALAALASEEIAARSTPEPRPAAARAAAGGASTAGAASVRTLVEQMDLPDGGGVDPTGAIPLPMKALETTGEHKMERISSVARGAEELRHRRSASRGIAIGAAAILLLGGGALAYWYTGRTAAPAPAPARPEPAAAAAPLPAAPVPEPVPAEPEPAVAAAPAPSEPTKAEPVAAAPEETKATAASEGTKPTAAPEETKAAAAPVTSAPEPEPVKAAPPPAPPKVARAPAETRVARREAARLAQQAAAAAPAPAPAAPAPAPRRRDVLDFESNDAALEAALGSSKPSGSRSVYVPPAPSGTSLQERVTDSQVNESILGRVSALQQCVQQQKARDAEATGVLKMRWAIAPDGSARGAKCVTPEFASSPLAQCLSGVLNGTRFPKSRLGRQDVTFPIKF